MQRSAEGTRSGESCSAEACKRHPKWRKVQRRRMQRHPKWRILQRRKLEWRKLLQPLGRRCRLAAQEPGSTTAIGRRLAAQPPRNGAETAWPRPMSGRQLPPLGYRTPAKHNSIRPGADIFRIEKRDSPFEKLEFHCWARPSRAFEDPRPRSSSSLRPFQMYL